MVKSEYPSLKFDSRQGRNYAVAVGRLLEQLRLREAPRFSSLEEAEDCKQLGVENIMGIGYGFKIVDKKPLRKRVIHLAVVRKAPPEEVQVEYLADSLVRQYLGSKYRTDVVQIGFPEASRKNYDLGKFLGDNR